MIALSETWINKEKDIDVHIKCCVLYVTNRANKSGGAVALYIQSHFNIDDLMDCFAVEIKYESRRNMVVACVYRKPGANIETFTESLDTVMTDLNVNNIQTESPPPVQIASQTF